MSITVKRSHASLLPIVIQQYKDLYNLDDEQFTGELVYLAQARAINKYQEPNYEGFQNLFTITFWGSAAKQPLKATKLVETFSFFENVGYMCENGYLRYGDIVNLWGRNMIGLHYLFEKIIFQDKSLIAGELTHFFKLLTKSKEYFPEYRSPHYLFACSNWLDKQKNEIESIISSEEWVI